MHPASQDNAATVLVGQDHVRSNSVPRLPPEVLEMIWKAYCPAFSNDSRVVDLYLKIYTLNDVDNFIHLFASKRLIVRMRQLWHIMAINKATRQRALQLFPDSLSVRSPYTRSTCTIRLNKEMDLIMFRDILQYRGSQMNIIPNQPVDHPPRVTENSFTTAFRERSLVFSDTYGRFYYPSDQVLDACRPTVSVTMRPPTDWDILSLLQNGIPKLFPRLQTVFLCYPIVLRSRCKQELSWCVSGRTRQETLTPVTEPLGEPFVACWPDLRKNFDYANTHMSISTKYPKDHTLELMAEFLEEHSVKVWPMVIYRPQLMLVDSAATGDSAPNSH